MEKKFIINDFEGPLDLLLHLVRTSKMDIYEISTSEIIEQYLAFINEMESLNIDIASEYLVMASDLVHLKSRLLINKYDEEDLESEFGINSEEDLKNRLIEYEKYKTITDEFKKLESIRGEIYTKNPSNLDEYIVKKELPKNEMAVEDLVKAFLLMQERLTNNKPLSTKIAKKELNVNDRIKTIKMILDCKHKVDFYELFEIANNEYIIVTFLAILEMSKNKEITITQEDNFSKISVEKVNHE